jgi:hypothetical protein
MAEAEYSELIEAEIDGELDERRRGELSRRLLADPQARELREDLLRLREMLDTVGEVEPPPELQANVLRALPMRATSGGGIRRPITRWRYAAGIALVVGAAALVYDRIDSPGPGSAELVGTMAASRAPLILDIATVAAGPVAGQVSLYRDARGLGLAFELISDAPVEVLIRSEGRTLRVNGLGGTVAAERRTVALAGAAPTGGRTVDLTFVLAGREVGRATLRVPKGN